LCFSRVFVEYFPKKLFSSNAHLLPLRSHCLCSAWHRRRFEHLRLVDKFPHPLHVGREQTQPCVGHGGFLSENAVFFSQGHHSFLEFFHLTKHLNFFGSAELFPQLIVFLSQLFFLYFKLRDPVPE